MSTDPIFEGIVKCIRTTARRSLPSTIERTHSFIADLGFDSISITRLSIAMEDYFQRPIPLEDWIAKEADPAVLTIDSLCRHMAEASKAQESPATS